MIRTVPFHVQSFWRGLFYIGCMPLVVFWLPWIGNYITTIGEAYCQVSNVRRTKSLHLKDSRAVLRLSLPNPLKPDDKSRTTSEWSTILLPTKVRLILEVLRYFLYFWCKQIAVHRDNMFGTTNLTLFVNLIILYKIFIDETVFFLNLNHIAFVAEHVISISEISI